MKMVVIVQARMGSSRLPGKVLKELAGEPILKWVVSRSRQAQKVDDVIVATTTDTSDDAIANWCEMESVPCFRGSVYDVLDRFYQAGLAFEATHVVRVTGDCPLIDPQVIDDTIAFYEKMKVDFAANRLPPPWHRTFPIGLDVEIVSMNWLKIAWQKAVLQYEREHVMPWFYGFEGRCKVGVYDHDPDYGMHRWTVDTPEDYQLMQEIFSRLPNPLMDSWLDVLALIEKNPELELINRYSFAKNVDIVDDRVKKAVDHE